MIHSKTYAVGVLGHVKRSDDLGTTWVDVPVNIMGSPNSKTLADVEVTPSGNKVYIVGEADMQSYYKGIYYSTDDGLNWNASGGDYSTINRNHIWYEITVVDELNAFVCGSNGWVASTTDGGLNFNLCTQITGLYANGQRVKREILSCHSIHFITPLIGVVGLPNNVVVTLNGGLSWTPCCSGNGIEFNLPGVGYSGPWMGGVHCNLIPSTSDLQIVVLGSNHIYRSTDSGNSFYQKWDFTLTQGQSLGGYHLTWTDDFNLWGFGYNNQIVSSVDGGNTWNIVRPYVPIDGDYFISGHFYLGVQGFYGVSSTPYTTGYVQKTTDGAQYGVNSTDFDPTPTAIWTWFKSGDCFLLTPCDSQLQSFTVTNDLTEYLDAGYIKLCIPVTESSQLPDTGEYLTITDCCNLLGTQYIRTTVSFQEGSVVYLPNFYDRCWRVGKYGQTPNTHIPIDTTDYIVFKDCETCIGRFPCKPLSPPEGCNCYHVTIAPSCEGAITLDPEWTLTSYRSCEECHRICYLLISDCGEGSITELVTGNFTIGTYIKLPESDQCWKVTEWNGSCENSHETDTPTVFTTCEECIYIPPVVIPPPLNIRCVKPGYNTPGCSSEFTENINCKFASAVYNQIATLRYGVKICCDLDVDKWDVKKQILDLKAINDPTACTTELPENHCSSCSE